MTLIAENIGRKKNEGINIKSEFGGSFITYFTMLMVI